MALLDAQLVWDAARDVCINLVLAGHLHRPNTILSQPIVLVCAGSATVFYEAKGNYIHFLTVEVDAGRATLAGRRGLRWSGDLEQFVHVASDPPIIVNAATGLPGAVGAREHR